MKIEAPGIYENTGETPWLAEGLVIRSAVLSDNTYVWRTGGSYYSEATRTTFPELDFEIDPDDELGANTVQFEVAYGG